MATAERINEASCSTRETRERSIATVKVYAALRGRSRIHRAHSGKRSYLSIMIHPEAYVGATRRTALVPRGSAAAGVALRPHTKASMVVGTGDRMNVQALHVAARTVQLGRKAIGEVFTRVGGRGMTRPAVWKCAAETSNCTEDLM